MVAISKPNVTINCNASATVMLPPPYGGTDLSEVSSAIITFCLWINNMFTK